MPQKITEKQPAPCPECGEESIHEGLLCDDCNFDIEFDEDDRRCETCDNLGTITCQCDGDFCVCTEGPENPCPECGP